MTEQQREHKNKLKRESYHRNKEIINFKRRGGPKRVLLTDDEKKQKVKEYNDMVRAKMKLQPHKVYLLTDYNYVGTTQWLSKRFAQHNYSKGWDCSNYQILFEHTDREECLKFESTMHELGYEGGNSKHASYR
jgi:predicted GIY-YIG superfamily endonuclease